MTGVHGSLQVDGGVWSLREADDTCSGAFVANLFDVAVEDHADRQVFQDILLEEAPCVHSIDTDSDRDDGVDCDDDDEDDVSVFSLTRDDDEIYDEGELVAERMTADILFMAEQTYGKSCACPESRLRSAMSELTAVPCTVPSFSRHLVPTQHPPVGEQPFPKDWLPASASVARPLVTEGLPGRQDALNEELRTCLSLIVAKQATSRDQAVPIEIKAPPVSARSATVFRRRPRPTLSVAGSAQQTQAVNSPGMPPEPTEERKPSQASAETESTPVCIVAPAVLPSQAPASCDHAVGPLRPLGVPRRSPRTLVLALRSSGLAAGHQDEYEREGSVTKPQMNAGSLPVVARRDAQECAGVITSQTHGASSSTTGHGTMYSGEAVINTRQMYGGSVAAVEHGDACRGNAVIASHFMYVRGNGHSQHDARDPRSAFAYGRRDVTEFYSSCRTPRPFSLKPMGLKKNGAPARTSKSVGQGLLPMLDKNSITMAGSVSWSLCRTPRGVSRSPLDQQATQLIAS